MRLFDCQILRPGTLLARVARPVWVVRICTDGRVGVVIRDVDFPDSRTDIFFLVVRIAAILDGAASSVPGERGRACFGCIGVDGFGGGGLGGPPAPSR